MSATQLDDQQNPLAATLWALMGNIGVDTTGVLFDPENQMLVFPTVGRRNRAIEDFEANGLGLSLHGAEFAGVQGTAARLRFFYQKAPEDA